MAAPALHNQHRTNTCFHLEAGPGEYPADAAAWATSEAGGTGPGRFMVTEADPSFIRGTAAVPNVDMQPRVFEVDKPHKGLPTSDGGAITMRCWGSGETYSDDVQVTESGQGILLEHALGVASLGQHTAIAVGGVTSTTVVNVTSATNAVVGQIVCISAAAAPTRFFPVQITAISGVEFTYDRVLPFTVNDGDLVLGCEQAYPGQAELTNPADGGASTLSILYQRGPECWLAAGAHLGLTSMTWERGEQPKFVFDVLAAYGAPPGVTGAPSEPTWTGSIEGDNVDTYAIGRDTKCRLQTFGVTTASDVSLFSAALTVGVPVLPQDGVTEETDGMPGRVGYRTEPAETIVEIVVALASAEQTRWTAGTLLTCTYYQVSAQGRGWCVHIAKGFLMESPEPVFEGSNRYKLKIQATENSAGTTELAKAKIIIARY